MNVEVERALLRGIQSIDASLQKIEGHLGRMAGTAREEIDAAMGRAVIDWARGERARRDEDVPESTELP